ncbi:MAG TPA: type III pantothenate kinase [Elusimicrobiales bacterium]|nr:type III pantothenate kinase [Elusimicrobiales bacterium]
MLLALDAGNSQIFGGVFKGDELLFKFRKTSKGNVTSDEFGIFFKSVLRENSMDPAEIRDFAVCSVVPDLVYSLTQSAVKYFGLEPFLIQTGIKTGLNIRYKNPAEIGADRIATAIAGTRMFEGKDLIIVDLGTATTFCAVSGKKEYLGGLILPGLKISMEALARETAKLPRVEIVRPAELVGRTTVEGIQSGLYHGHFFAIKGIVGAIKAEYFRGEDPLVIGTGGFSKMFESAGVFDKVEPDLVLKGIAEAVKLNKARS